jgi:hypothetical protein
MEVIKRFGDRVFARNVSASVAGADRRRHDTYAPKWIGVHERSARGPAAEAAPVSSKIEHSPKLRLIYLWYATYVLLVPEVWHLQQRGSHLAEVTRQLQRLLRSIAWHVRSFRPGW